MTSNVVITGMGIVSPLGNTPDIFWQNLLKGVSGVKSIQRFNTEQFSVKFGGEVTDFDATPYLEPKEVARTSRYVQYLLHAAVSAANNAGINKDNIDKTRAGLILGSGMGGIEVFTRNAGAMITKSPSRVSPFFIPQAITNMGSGMASILLGWMGPNWAVASACATANHAIMTAADQIILGRADVMIAGGSEEAVCEAAVAGFSNMKALSRRNDAPHKASCPFDKNRDGFVLGEGGGALVLESEQHARARGAHIYGTIMGYGASCDAYHMSAPLETGDGVAIAINNAIKDAGLQKEDIKVVNCHATSTPLGDVAEVRALKKIFGSHAQSLKLQATKSMTGHLLGGASAIEAIALTMALNSRKLHPTINLENQDPECDLDCVPNTMQEFSAEYGISNSFGFGGHNSTVVIKRGAS